MHYFLLIAERCPSNLLEENSFLLIQEQDLESDVQITEVSLMHDEKQDPADNDEIEELSFMTTLVVNSMEPELIVREFKEWWNENVGGEVGLELLTTDINALTAERAAYVQSLEPDQWSIKNSFVAYPSVSRKAYGAAKEIVVASELSIH